MFKTRSLRVSPSPNVQSGIHAPHALTHPHPPLQPRARSGTSHPGSGPRPDDNVGQERLHPPLPFLSHTSPHQPLQPRARSGTSHPGSGPRPDDDSGQEQNLTPKPPWIPCTLSHHPHSFTDPRPGAEPHTWYLSLCQERYLTHKLSSPHSPTHMPQLDRARSGTSHPDQGPVTLDDSRLGQERNLTPRIRSPT